MTTLGDIHAIYVALGEVDLLRNSIDSIYAHVAGITIVTTYDRDWLGAPRADDGVADLVLSRSIDPEHKIELLVLNETNEARARNRAMDAAVGRQRRHRVRRQHGADVDRPPIGYFLIVDADEIWESDDLNRLVAHASQDRGAWFRAGAYRYFKRWNYRIAGLEWSTVLVRSDQRFTWLRNRPVARARLLAARAPWPPRISTWLRGYADVPESVAVFHHGSYVGPRERIAQKLKGFGHQHEVRHRWLEDVYDHWDPSSTDFHPVVPERFAATCVIRTDQLPSAVRSGFWPDPAQYFAMGGDRDHGATAPPT